MAKKKKGPNVSQFYCWKNHKNLWKIVAELIEFVLEKKKLLKAFQNFIGQKVTKFVPKKSIVIIVDISNF
jgi:hypothetical protein